MGRSASRGWMAFCLIGIAVWIGITVLVTVLNDDPADGGPVLVAFAAGGGVFFGVVFGVALWQTRPDRDPELDALLAELSLEPGAATAGAVAIGAMRRVARAYILLGALVTALGLLAICEQALEFGSVAVTLYALLAIVVAWALAVPLVLRGAYAASAAVLGPLGLAQSRRSATLAGERHGRAVRVEITARGSVTRLATSVDPPALGEGEILAYAGRGEAATWAGVRVEADGERITVRRTGQRGPAWLWDLWLAERLASEG